MKTTDKKEIRPDEEKVIFVPAEDLRTLESICDEMEQVRDELRKIASSLTLSSTNDH